MYTSTQFHTLIVLSVGKCEHIIRDTLLPPATRLWQDNAFTPVCDSAHRVGVSVGGGGLCPVGSLSGRSLSGGVPVREIPLCGNVRVVYILLECILVLNVLFNSMFDHLSRVNFV